MRINQLMENNNGQRAQRFFRKNGGEVYDFDQLPKMAKLIENI